MARISGKRYRSYKEKKSQTKRFRRHFIRFFIMVITYWVFTSFFAVSVNINGNSMEPSVSDGDLVVFHPTRYVNTFLHKSSSGVLKRGEMVFTGTSYEDKTSFLESLLDPIVRIFTLQKKTLVYDNSSFKGRVELLRVVGLPGDTIKIKDSTVYIKPAGDDFFLSEFELADVDYDIIKNEFSNSWKKEYPFSSESDELYVNTGFYYLISDNRAVINDSRVLGLIDQSSIKGRVLLKYWPIDEISLF